MPNTKSAAKRMRTSMEKHDRNKAVRHRVRTAAKKFDATLEGGSEEERSSAYRELCSIVDKAVKKGAVKANSAARRKSRASKKISNAA